MLLGFVMHYLLVVSIFCLAATLITDSVSAQPAGGGSTGGTATGGTVRDGNTTGGGGPGGGNLTGGAATGGNVSGGVNVGEERRYTVEFKNFRVLDETGCDFCGSDETIFIIRTSDYALRSTLYGNLDSPLYYRFKRCPQPAIDEDGVYDHEWECDQRGKAPPFSFTVAAYEDDGFGLFSFCGESIPIVNGRDSDIFPPNASFCVESRGELIGKSKVELNVEDLDELRSPGQSFPRDIHLTGGCDASESSCASGGSPHYVIYYEVKRLPDAAGGLPVDPNP